MIAAVSGGASLPRVRWTLPARGSLRELAAFLEAQVFGDPNARRLEIKRAIESLRSSPLRCPVYAVKYGLAFRRLVVNGRFFVFYVYAAPRGASPGGTLWIRAVKHASSQHPFLGVREVDNESQPLLTTAIA
jgi:plasmid stabilization system protein ParE